MCSRVCVCVFQREKNPHHSSTEKGEQAEDRAAISRHGPQHTSQSQHRHHKPVISQASESRTTSQNKNQKRKAKRLDEKGGESGGGRRQSPPPPPHPCHTSLHRSSLSSRQENATVKHGRSDCGLVEAVSVSGRGNALINPVRVKDTGACKADPGFVLHCLCFRATATT